MLYKSNDFKIKDYLKNIAEGYELKKISTYNIELTISKFEIVENNYIKQANKLAEFMFDYWKNRNK